MDYKSSGVDIEAGDALVDWLTQTDKDNQNTAKKNPHFDRIVSGIGGFASLFRADFPQMKKPCLVTCTDGVGTKVKLASQYKKFEGIGQDLVAMCVNDLICTGGEPLLFLDYYATGKLNLPEAKLFLSGVKNACLESDCALVGGETAEMPGVYHDGDFDCAGFAVGIVDEEKTLGPRLVKKSDRLLGVSSSGFHSNGYSLLRQVFAQDMDRWIEQLMRPTALYVKLFKALKKQIDLHAISHITGGGIENIPRVLGNYQWKMKSWQWPEIFLEVQKRTKMSDEKMLTTLNCGIGLVLVLSPDQVQAASKIIQAFGFQVFDLGEIAGEKA